MTDTELRILGGKAFVEDLAQIGPTVAIGVFQIENMRRRRHHHAAFPRHQTVGEQQTVCEDAAVFIAAVAVVVLQDADASLRRLAWLRPVGIIAHLHYPELAVFIEGHRHRTFHFRLCRRQLEA